MRRWMGRILPSIFICAVGAAAVLIGATYFNFISKRIYEDSTEHLEEIYGQVNRSFESFVERNWGLLNGWSDALALAEGTVDEKIPGYIAQRREYWGFSEFYFLSEDGMCMTLNGTRSAMDLGAALEDLTERKEPVMAGTTLEDGQGITVFAVPVKERSYNGFGFSAIAVSYTNADIARSLNVDAFSGKAKCFVIRKDGDVLLSPQTGGGVFANYYVYLKAASDLSQEKLSRILDDWESGTPGLVSCRVGNEAQYILYQPVGYQDYVLLSVVPQSVVSAGFLSVQHTTALVLVAIFLLIGIMVIAPIIASNLRRSRKSRTELQYREYMFGVLSNSVDDIFIMLDAKDNSVDYISPNIERLLGISHAEAQKDIRVMEKCAVGGNAVIPREELERVPLQGSQSRDYEYMHQHTGERRFYRMTMYHMNILDTAKYIIVLSDRTQEKQMNRQLQEALTAAQSANEAKSNFLSNMSHDIRTPMNAIIGFSVLLERDADRPEKVHEYIRKITAASQHLLSLINDVLDMSKIESGKTSLNVETFSLPELLEELSIIMLPQAKAKNQEFEIRVQGVPPEQLMGDKLRLNQILLNLLSNAVKYTPEQGRIEFTVCDLPSGNTQFAKLRFLVQDNGIGMSGDYVKQIFVPFSREINSVTNRIQGTGLGMAITKNLVDLMGGIIQVDSKPGEGSTFTVELSFALPEEEHGEESFGRGVTRMLVADDEEQVCTEVQEMMRDTGVDVSWVTNGADAVEAAVAAHQSGKDFHVILLDWKMPELNGVETARRIRERVGEKIPILVLTSYDWSEIETQARQAGIDAFLPKPFFVSSFRQALKPLLDRQDAGKELTAQEQNAGSVMQGRRFLIAEDNELNAEILTEMMRMEGAECDLAVNGQEALDKFEHSQPGHYDMILMDVQMPVMNGYEATRRIRACGHPEAGVVPIAAMTANTFAEDVRNALDAGMDGHLAKPIDMTAVKELAARLLNRTDRERRQGQDKGDGL